MAAKKFKTVYDVVCPFCGTLCDDLEVDVDTKENLEWGVKIVNRATS